MEKQDKNHTQPEDINSQEGVELQPSAVQVETSGRDTSKQNKDTSKEKEIIEKVLKGIELRHLAPDIILSDKDYFKVQQAIRLGISKGIIIGKEEALAEKDKIGRNYKTNYWELYYPDGTSSITNFNPLKNKEEEFSKKIDEAKFLTKMEKFMINDKILGMKNSHTLKDGVS